MSTDKTIMILGASILQLPAIRQARNMGLNVVALDMNPEAVGFQVPGVIKEVISTIDIPAAVECAKRHQIDGVMTLATDMPMRAVATVAKECGLVGISEETAIKTTDKSRMRQALKENGVPIPVFYAVSSEQEYLDAVKQFNKPFVVKPSDSSGSRGICLIQNLKDQEMMLKAYRKALQYSRNQVVMVEEYMTGREVSVETLAVNGIVHVIQVTDKITTGAPHFVEMGHSQPAQFDENVLNQIKQVAIQANQATGIDNGPSHTEIKVTEEGPKIVELGARLGGDCITTHLVPLSTGVNMVEVCIQIALGDTPDLTNKYSRGSAIRYFSQREGTITGITGIEAARNIPGVKEICVVHGVGETITEVKDSGSRMGFVIAEGSTAEEAVRNCETALDKIQVTIV